LSTSYPIDQSAEHASVAQSNIDLAAKRRAVRLLEYNVTIVRGIPFRRLANRQQRRRIALRFGLGGNSRSELWDLPCVAGGE